jgi:F-type H+-transporting ATPase subunit alpha
VQRFEAELLEYFSSRHADIVEAIRTTGAIPDVDAFEAGIREFAERFTPSSGPDDEV